MTKITAKPLIFLLLILFYLTISIINQPPDGYFFVLGDTEQIVNFENFFWKKNGIWESSGDGIGRVDNNFLVNSYYYIIYFIIKLFNLPITSGSIFLKFTYLFFSFLSFYYSLIILKIDINFKSKFFLSIAYSINFFTFYFFWYTWGYATSIFYYFFAPILISSFISYTYQENIKLKLKFLIKLLPLFFLSNLAFGNLAWMMITLVIYLFVVSYKIIFNFKTYDYKLIILELAFLTLFTLLFLIFNFGSIFINFLSINANLSLADTESLKSWVLWQTQALPSAFFFIQHYRSLDTMHSFQLFSIFNYIFIFLLLLKNKLWENNLKFFIILNIFIIFVTFKGNLILPNFLISNFFFDTLFYGFRSEDKSSILLFFCVLTLISFLLVSFKKNQANIALGILIINMLSAYPLVLGGMNVDHGVNISKKKITTFKSLKTIDKDLLNFQELTSSNTDNDIYNVIETPYAVTASPAWYDFKNISHHGLSFYPQFSKKQVIGLNSNQNLLGEEVIPYWSFRANNNDWDINILSILSVKYILNHKDMPRTKHNNTSAKFTDLVNKKVIDKIYAGENIDIFQVKEKYLNKKIYIPKTIIKDCLLKYDTSKEIKPIAVTLNTAFDNKNCNLDFRYIEKLTNQLNKKDINSTYQKTGFEDKNKILYEKHMASEIDNIMYDRKENKFTFNAKNLKENFYIVFTQRFNKLWELKCTNCKNNQKINHIIINNSLNGWDISKNDQENLKFEISFKANKYISIYLLFLLTILLSAIWIKKRFLN